MPELTIAMLSWGHHKTLINTLSSYQNGGLLFNPNIEYIIYFQEVSKGDERIAKLFGFEAYGWETNIGIAPAYDFLVRAAKGDCFLFLENDWELRELPWKQLNVAMFRLLDGVYDVVRFRHRQHPGHPLWTRQFQGRELTRPEHLLDCVHWVERPADRFKDYIGWDDPFFNTTARYANWTNNPTMFRTNWLKEIILPRIGIRDIEIDLQSWWQEQDFVVAQGEGLFTHNRL
jgi:hypothetical protein